MFQIGLTQCLFYVFLGLSLLVYGLSHVKNHQLLYMCIISIATIVYLIAPICLSFNIPVTALYFIFAIGFGFFQGPCFPITLLIVRAFYDPKVNGGLFGFWSSSGDIGIIMYIFCVFSKIAYPSTYVFFCYNKHYRNFSHLQHKNRWIETIKNPDIIIKKQSPNEKYKKIIHINIKKTLSIVNVDD